MLSIYGRLFLTASLFIGGTDAEGCKGGNTFNYGNEGYECNCNPVACTNETCVNDMGGEWTSDCPDCDPDECDPLAASDIDDPSCTGAPEMIDRFGKKMYRRKLIASEKPQDSEEGVFCHLTFELCGDESFITQGIDTGFGDYIRIAAADPEKWETYEGPVNGKTYSGMNDATTARSYSPVNPLNEHKAQFIIKEEKSDSEENNCTPEENCKFGFSELACFAPVGTDFLLSVVPDHGGTDTTHYVYEPNFSREPGAGPYTVNIIGQGVAITELNVLGISELLEPFASDGSYSTIKVVNYLWANSYWSNAEWVFEKSESNDLARKLFQDMAQYGIRFNLMHAISREERPEAEFPRTNVTVIGDAFQLTNTTDQDPNIKWFVVGSGNYKKAIYPQIVEWGFDMQPCSEKAASKGYPYCGPNSLYEWAEMGYNGLEDRERSEIFKYSAGDLTTPSADANSADQIETDPYAGDPELSVDQSSGSSSDDNSESSSKFEKLLSVLCLNFNSEFSF